MLRISRITDAVALFPHPLPDLPCSSPVLPPSFNARERSSTSFCHGLYALGARKRRSEGRPEDLTFAIGLRCMEWRVQRDSSTRIASKGRKRCGVLTVSHSSYEISRMAEQRRSDKKVQGDPRTHAGGMHAAAAGGRRRNKGRGLALPRERRVRTQAARQGLFTSDLRAAANVHQSSLFHPQTQTAPH